MGDRPGRFVATAEAAEAEERYYVMLDEERMAA